MDWFENDDFWRELYPYMFPADRFAASHEQVEQLLKLTGITGRTALDLCCGPGRHAVALAQRGLEVTGVDRSQFLLERARERASEAGVSVEWVMEDMRRFRRPLKFDLACNMFTSFGYFEEEEDNLRVLRNVHESLRDGGAFVMEMLGKERLARVLQSAICTDYPDGAVVLQRPRVRDDWSRVDNEWTILKDGVYRIFRLDHAIYSGRELKDRLTACGFKQVGLFGDLQGSPYGVDAARLVAVARKVY
jgi:SAM-dependent methyltransferase